MGADPISIPLIQGAPFVLDVAVFAGAALIILRAGRRLTRHADRLADLTGLGEAITGAVLLGAATSLPGIVTSVTAAAAGYPELALANAIGGIAVQTVFIALADLTYRRANLEHAAADPSNLLLAGLSIALLTLPLAASLLPAVEWAGIHPATPAVLIAYLAGLRMVHHHRREPMWGPTETVETEPDVPDESCGDPRLTAGLGLRMAATALVVAAAGWATAVSGMSIVDRTGLGEGFVGAILTGVSTSLPELVTTLAAVRRGALTLAVGGIVGGNTFDVLFAAFADIAYREGSIYHAISRSQSFLIVVTILMTSVLLLGLIRRERRGIANVGFEGPIVMALYVLGVAGIVVLD